MKKIRFLAILILFTLTIGDFAGVNDIANAKVKTASDIKAAYVVVNAKTGEVILSNKSNKRVYPASVTKVLTILTVMDKMSEKGLSLDSYVKVTKKMIKSVPSGSKCAYLGVKKYYKYRDIIGLVMVASAADAVKVLEKSLFGTEKKLAAAMNNKAREIGVTGSNFDNGIGLDQCSGYKNIYTTPMDMGKIAQYASTHCPIINEMSAKKKIVVRDKKRKVKHVFRSTNLFYRTAKYSKSRYTVVGMKTGYTRRAGVTLITKAVSKVDGTELIVAMFNVKGKENTYQNTRVLLDECMN